MLHFIILRVNIGLCNTKQRQKKGLYPLNLENWHEFSPLSPGSGILPGNFKKIAAFNDFSVIPFLPVGFSDADFARGRVKVFNKVNWLVIAGCPA
jgi:hypothetical protein